ncbi:MAG: hypothetical protein OXB92_14875 [Acidimicrobiaceae bacterium]|nr:hypothetical protein [Acidimicrobiaceae bacterium]
MTLRELRAEYDSAKIGPKIWGLVLESARAVSRRYPTDVYNNAEPWSDDSVADLAQEVVLERLLGEAQLQYLFNQATDLESWRRLLSFQVRRTLIRRRRATVLDTLLSRIRRLGREPPLRLETFGSKLWIVGEDPEGGLVDLEPSAVTRLAGSVRHIPQLVADQRASRASMVYRTTDLQTLLATVLEEVGAISESDLASVLELLLTSWIPTFLEDSEQVLGRDAEGDGPVEMLEKSEMRSVIETFAASLSEAEQEILLSKSQGVPDAEIAGRLGRSRPWVAQRKQLVLDRVGNELMRGLEGPQQTGAMETLLVAISDSLAQADGR